MSSRSSVFGQRLSFRGATDEQELVPTKIPVQKPLPCSSYFKI
jgi:hypothetical protein